MWLQQRGHGEAAARAPRHRAAGKGPPMAGTITRYEQVASGARTLLDLLDELPLTPGDHERLHHAARATLDAADHPEPEPARLSAYGRELLALLARVDTTAQGAVIAQLVTQALRSALGLDHDPDPTRAPTS